MTRTLTLAIALFAMAPAAEAGFILDDFDTPTVGAHNSDGSTVAITNSLFTQRLVNDDSVGPPFLLSIASGSLSAQNILPGNMAFIEWSIPTSGDAFLDLEFQNFVETGIPGSLQYNVLLDEGMGFNSLTGGYQTLSGPVLTTGLQAIDPGDVLRLEFLGVSGVGSFSADGIIANPEPMSACLFGLALFGGVCRHRRRRD